MSSVLQNIRIVLVHTTHPGNIGAVARAMKTMCLSELYLVKPKLFPNPAAVARAKQGADILDNATVVATLAEAIADCCYAVGTGAQTRYLNWPLLNINEAAGIILREACRHKLALVFGNERTGLTNQELHLCNAQLVIPANPAYSSLNLAAAVQVVAYEIYKHFVMQNNSHVDHIISELANQADMAGFYDHLEQTLTQIGYLKTAQPNLIMPRLQKLFNRSRLEKTEAQILRGILTAMQKKITA